VTLVQQPVIGLAKQLVSIVQDPSNAQASTVTFSLLLRNYGNVPLSNVNVTDNLAAVFTAPASFTVTSVTSADFTVNAGYNGAGNTSLLAAGNTLAVGASGTIKLVVHVATGGNQGPYSNSATASGTSPGNVQVTRQPQ
jgi:uncharacterized repeat protein (TIGR01451 family)